MSIKYQVHFLTLVKDHSDFKVKRFDFGLYTQVSDSGPQGPLVIYSRTPHHTILNKKMLRSHIPKGWSGGSMVLGKLPVLGRPTNLGQSRARAYCACSRCGWGLFGHFFSRLSFLFLSPSLWEMTRYRLKYCLKGPLSPKTTNQPHPKPMMLRSHIIP